MIQQRRTMLHADLILVDMLGRGRIDAPVETEDSSEVVDLQALRFRRGSEDQKLRRIAGEVDQEGDGSLCRAKDGPVRGTWPLQAGMDHVFRTMGLVSLGDEAAALVEQLSNTIRQAGKRTDGKAADAVGG